MNKIYAEEGGRPRKIDDLLLIQDEAAKALAAPLKKLQDEQGDFVLYGCVSNPGAKAISSGMAFIAGQFVEFEGATNVNFPTTMVLAEQFNTPLQYESGDTLPTRKKVHAALTDGITTGIVFDAAGNYKELSDLTMRTYANQAVDGTKNFRGNLLVKNVNVLDTLNSLRADLTAGIASLTATITSNYNTLVQSITTNVAALNATIASLASVVNTKVTRSQTFVPWTNISLTSSSFGVGGSGFYEPQFMKTEDGFVHLRGRLFLEHPNYGSGSIASLPASIATEKESRFIVLDNSGLFSFQVCIARNQLFVFPNFQSYQQPTGQTAFFLDGLTFLADDV